MSAERQSKLIGLFDVSIALHDLQIEQTSNFPELPLFLRSMDNTDITKNLKAKWQ